uniref:lytic transglycosylase domain-containing protein n=1 Tax=Photobacterium leiognathi TaxID=553611 RepID=UPI003B968011
MKWILATLTLFITSSASAFCFNEAGEKFNVNPRLLAAICFTESSFRVDAVNKNNSDGTVDNGLCQINSWWYPKLEKFGISVSDLKTDACLNTHVSAWILAQNFKTHGENWNSVGAYNAGFKKEPSRCKK